MTRVKAPTSPRSVLFRKEREGEWVELEMLVDRVLRRGLSSLTEEELYRLPVLYRAALSALSVARTTALDRALLDYLEALAARAYLAVYGSRRPSRAAVRTFFIEQFPRAVRGIWRELAAATGLFLLGGLVAFGLYISDAHWFYAFVGAEMASGRTPAATTELLRNALYDGGEKSGLSIFASFLFTHNARIGMAAFALGIAAGVPTALLLFINGAILGAFIALHVEHGLLVPLLGWLLPHGVPEITAVLLCGAAGLTLGRAVVFPGSRRVRDALVHSGRQAALVVAGAVLLFAVAGVIEGIFRQSVTHDGVRLALAAFNFVWLGLWLFAVGHGTRPEDSP